MYETHNNTAFQNLSDFDNFSIQEETNFKRVLLSPEYSTPIPADELILSWNASLSGESALNVEIRALCSGVWSRFYILGKWSLNASAFPRESITGQKDDMGEVNTDTLSLTNPAQAVQLRITLLAVEGAAFPALKLLSLCYTDTSSALQSLPPEKAAWGYELTVPAKSQLGWQDGNGWCSPTSTAMVLAFWAEKLNRLELDVTVPTAARAVYDRVWEGTGNWPFNTAYAGSFEGMIAYVTRLSDITELETLILAGAPPVASVSYDLLKGKEKAGDSGHLMVCCGFTADGDIVLNDPYYHADQGEVCRRVFSRERFIFGWKHSRNLIYLIYPDSFSIPSSLYNHW